MKDGDSIADFGQIAVIGMAGRFPGAGNVNEFWANLCAGVESIAFFSDEEMERAGIPRELYQSPNYVKAKGTMDGTDLFDAGFFGFNPREAEIMDPQHRLFLECAWEALENAGYDPGRFKGRIGVFAGCGMNSYVFNVLSNAAVMDMVGPFQVMIANDKDFLPTIVSYKLNLRGPSVNVQTACSTSLVAVHVACQSLLNGECDIAVAGGVSISVPKQHGYLYIEGDVHSPDGHCRAYDAKARGTLDGEGVGIVVLKRQEQACLDRDRVHAVIKGSSINNDGSAKVGFTAPSEDGQAQVIAETLALAGLEPEDIGFVEGHGTGTLLGDPIEVAALTQAFRGRTEQKNFCALGSLKTNVGHLNSAAGVAGLIKAVMCLKHGKIPPTVNFDEPNPAIDFANSPFFVNKEVLEWPATNSPRRAGVSSFGIGGTNAHVVLEEAPVADTPAQSRPWQLLLLSARTQSALERTTANLLQHMQTQESPSLPDIAYTLQTGRKRFDWRRAVLCRSVEDAIAALASNDPERVFTTENSVDGARVVFMFPGGGTQYLNMGLDLYRDEPVFREELDRCAEMLKPMLDCDIREVIFALPNEAVNDRIKQTYFALPALFAMEYALARLWMTWGIHPAAMIGHSLGQYTAACIAGVFSLKDALSLVAMRGKLLTPLPAGAMLSVSLPEEELRGIIPADISVAAINAPTRCILSGGAQAIEQLDHQLTERGIECRVLHIDAAGHSSLMESVLDPFRRFLENVRLHPPSIPFMSNVSGTWITAEEATSPEYWARHLRQTVRFRDGIEELLKDPGNVFVEVGPGRALGTLLKLQTSFTPDRYLASSLRHPYDGTPDQHFLLKNLGELWLAGVTIDWEGFYGAENRRREPLPAYPFERKRYWIEKGSDSRVYDGGRKSAQISKKQDIAEWFYLPGWKESARPPAPGLEEYGNPSLPIIVFAGEHGLGKKYARQLKEAGQTVITVTPGARFEQLDEASYSFAPGHHHEYADLIERVLSTVGPPKAIAHFWGVDEGNFENDYDRGFYSLLFLAQALAKKAVFSRLKMLAVASNLQSVTGEEKIDSAKATVLGPCEVIPQEYPNIRCQIVDVRLPAAGTREEQRLLRDLSAELVAEPCDHVVAYRGARRWTQIFLQARDAQRAPADSPWKPHGIYLITGGMGNVGLALAEYLAIRFQARLVLAGRSSFPRREEWERLAEIPGGEEKVQVQIRKLLEMERAGACVRVVEADVADFEQAQMCVRLAAEQFGGLDGVIHAAAIVGNEMATMIAEASTEDCARQFRPKISGALALANALQDVEPDFCALLSSLSSTIGGIGFTAYSAANAFLDAFAQSRRREGKTRWISIDSDIWQFQRQASNGETWAQLPMTPEEGVEAIERALLLEGSPRVMISTGDLQSRVDQWVNFDPLDLESAESAEPAHSYSRPNLRNAYAPPQTDVERVVVSILETCLGIDQIGIHDNFFDLGGQSLLATRVVSALRDAFQVEISLRALFEKPTAAAMAKTIEAIAANDQVDVATIARLINEVSSLTMQEARAKLAAKRG